MQPITRLYFYAADLIICNFTAAKVSIYALRSPSVFSSVCTERQYCIYKKKYVITRCIGDWDARILVYLKAVAKVKFWQCWWWRLKPIPFDWNSYTKYVDLRGVLYLAEPRLDLVAVALRNRCFIIVCWKWRKLFLL